MTTIIGHTVTFQGAKMGVVIADDIKPVGWSATKQRVITLDNGVALRDVTAPAARQSGWATVPPGAVVTPPVAESGRLEANATPVVPEIANAHSAAKKTTPQLLKPWSEYPVGSKAHAVGGGHWYRTEAGWKWNGPDGCGSTFPTPGADTYVVTEPGAEIVGQI